MKDPCSSRQLTDGMTTFKLFCVETEDNAEKHGDGFAHVTTAAEGSDTTDDDSSNDAKYKILQSL